MKIILSLQAVPRQALGCNWEISDVDPSHPLSALSAEEVVYIKSISERNQE